MPNFQVRLDQTLNGEAVYNVTNWQLQANDAITLQEFADAIRASYVLNVINDLSASWSLDGITVRQMDGGSPFTTPYAFTLGPLAGTELSALLPLFNALLVSTSFLGPRPNRGRVFFPGICENVNTTGGVFAAGPIAAFGTMVQSWANGLVATTGNCFLRIARPNFTLNTWTLNSPVETAIGRAKPSMMQSRRPK